MHPYSQDSVTAHTHMQHIGEHHITKNIFCGFSFQKLSSCNIGVGISENANAAELVAVALKPPRAALLRNPPPGFSLSIFYSK